VALLFAVLSMISLPPTSQKIPTWGSSAEVLKTHLLACPVGEYIPVPESTDCGSSNSLILQVPLAERPSGPLRAPSRLSSERANTDGMTSFADYPDTDSPTDLKLSKLASLKAAWWAFD
jgi:hypothetical protein